MSDFSDSNAEIKIRRAEPPDIAAILEVQAAVNLGYWTNEDFLPALADNSMLVFIAFDQNKTIGFVVARLITTVVEIFNIAVLLEFRQQKIGQRLFDAIICQAKTHGAAQCWLEVRESNLAARKFYAANNFKIVGRSKNYYHEPLEDAILMTLDFSDDNPKK